MHQTKMDLFEVTLEQGGDNDNALLVGFDHFGKQKIIFESGKLSVSVVCSGPG